MKFTILILAICIFSLSCVQLDSLRKHRKSHPSKQLSRHGRKMKSKTRGPPSNESERKQRWDSYNQALVKNLQEKFNSQFDEILLKQLQEKDSEKKQLTEDEHMNIFDQETVNQFITDLEAGYHLFNDQDENFLNHIFSGNSELQVVKKDALIQVYADAFIKSKNVIDVNLERRVRDLAGKLPGLAINSIKKDIITHTIMAVAIVLPIPGSTLIAGIGIGIYKLAGYIGTVMELFDTHKDTMFKSLQSCYENSSLFGDDNDCADQGKTGATELVYVLDDIKKVQATAQQRLRRLRKLRHSRKSKKMNRRRIQKH